MKIEIDTINDSKSDIEKAINLLKDIISKKNSDFSSNTEPLQEVVKKNDDVVLPSKEDLRDYKKGKYNPDDEKSPKKTKESDDEPKIEVY